MTPYEAVKTIGKEFGKTELTDSEIEHIIWEKTGFPCFFAPRDGETAVDVFMRQVREHFESGVR